MYIFLMLLLISHYNIYIYIFEISDTLIFKCLNNAICYIIYKTNPIKKYN